MKTLWQRSSDLNRLKGRYKNSISGSQLAGLFAVAWLFAKWGYQAQLAWGLTPGAPVGSEPGSVLFLCLGLVLMLVGGVVGMSLGPFVFCLVLVALRQMSLRDALRAVFLSYYPPHWFRVEKPGSAS